MSSAHQTMRPVRAVLAVAPVFPMGAEGLVTGYLVADSGDATADGLYVFSAYDPDMGRDRWAGPNGHYLGYNLGQGGMWILSDTVGQHAVAEIHHTTSMTPPASGYHESASNGTITLAMTVTPV